MSSLLSSAAVGCRNGKEAKEILEAYIETAPSMFFNHMPGAALQQQPKGTGAGDHLVEPR